jgi:prophage maintenance system killer protein
MVVLIESNDFVFTASEEEAYDFIIEIATGNMHYDQIVHWLQHHSQAC